MTPAQCRAATKLLPVAGPPLISPRSCWVAIAGGESQMQTIFVSNRGDDNNYGLTKMTPIRSWKRCKLVRRGKRAIFLMEGEATLMRMKDEIDQAQKSGKPKPRNGE